MQEEGPAVQGGGFAITLLVVRRDALTEGLGRLLR